MATQSHSIHAHAQEHKNSRTPANTAPGSSSSSSSSSAPIKGSSSASSPTACTPFPLLVLATRGGAALAGSGLGRPLLRPTPRSLLRLRLFSKYSASCGRTQGGRRRHKLRAMLSPALPLAHSVACLQVHGTERPTC